MTLENLAIIITSVVIFFYLFRRFIKYLDYCRSYERFDKKELPGD